eukprot:15340433-Ditylum_brightwellii.AAC.1
MGAEELWCGAMSDLQYQENTGIFERQHEFCNNDLIEGEYLPFLNGLDKGYHTYLAAWQCGRQLTMQPNFAKSDRKLVANDSFLLCEGNCQATGIPEQIQSLGPVYAIPWHNPKTGMLKWI